MIGRRRIRTAKSEKTRWPSPSGEPRPIDLRTPTGDLQHTNYVLSASASADPDDILVLGIRRRIGRWALVSSSRVGSYSTAWRLVPTSRSLERVASERLGERARFVAHAHYLTWGAGAERPWRRRLLWLLASFVCITLSIAFAETVLFYLWLPALILFSLVISEFKRGPIVEPRPTAVHGTSLSRLRSQVPSVPDTLAIGAVSPPADLAAAAKRVDGVKAAYGALLSDVVYRVENSALFDTAVAPTREFTVLMARWDDRASMAADEAVDVARELELAFETARAHAEALGLGHLPSTARPSARRAVKALQTAQRAATDGERSAALSQATRILASLALYYLPSSAETTRILGGAAPGLPRPE